MAKLTLHAAYGRFRADMFLSSLTESSMLIVSNHLVGFGANKLAIALPMGMSTRNELALSPQILDILGTLDNAETLFWANLTLIARRGSVPDVRDAFISLALIRSFQTSLGKSSSSGPAMAVGLLGNEIIIFDLGWIHILYSQMHPRLSRCDEKC
jgi:separase